MGKACISFLSLFFFSINNSIPYLFLQKKKKRLKRNEGYEYTIISVVLVQYMHAWVPGVFNIFVPTVVPYYFMCALMLKNSKYRVLLFAQTKFYNP